MRTIKNGILALLACILMLNAANLIDADLSCLDEQGQPVDWFIGYKFPKLNGDESFESGTAYSFMTSRDVDHEDDKINSRTDDPETKIFIYRFRDLLLKYIGFKAPKKSMKKLHRRIGQIGGNNSRWIASEYAISDHESILMRTLAPAFDRESSNVNSVFYNDDPTDTSESNYKLDDEGELKKKNYNNRRAHAKGVLLMDDQSMNGLWLTHSIPRFPKIRSMELNYPGSGVRYGQTFMCVSFKIADAGKQLVDHLVNMRVLVYDNQISEKLYHMIPALKNLDIERNLVSRRIPVKPQLSQMITTRGGQVLHLFSKALSLNDDLYSGWIDEELGTDLYVETWRNGQGTPLDSFCPKGNHHVNNVKDLKYDNKLKWSYLKDHSKWAISEVKNDGIVCIADSNRMESQFKRGGGAVCIKCSTCWDVFSNTIQDVEPCPLDISRYPKTQAKDPRETLEKIRQALHL